MKLKDYPDVLKPFVWFGVDCSQYSPNSKEISAECPWCGDTKKFSITTATGQWQCWSCQEGSKKGGGNIYTFIQRLHEASLNATKDHEYEELANQRGIKHTQTLKDWKIAKSFRESSVSRCSSPRIRFRNSKTSSYSASAFSGLPCIL